MKKDIFMLLLIVNLIIPVISRAQPYRARFFFKRSEPVNAVIKDVSFNRLILPDGQFVYYRTLDSLTTGDKALVSLFYKNVNGVQVDSNSSGYSLYFDNIEVDYNLFSALKFYDEASFALCLGSEFYDRFQLRVKFYSAFYPGTVLELAGVYSTKKVEWDLYDRHFSLGFGIGYQFHFQRRMNPVVIFNYSFRHQLSYPLIAVGQTSDYLPINIYDRRMRYYKAADLEFSIPFRPKSGILQITPGFKYYISGHPDIEKKHPIVLFIEIGVHG